MSQKPELSLGILGGGQLALMMCEAASPLGIHTVVLCPDGQAPARRACDDYIQADYEDTEALEQLGNACDVVTLDNEHIPLAALKILGELCQLRPDAEIMAQLQDRLAQRRMLEQLKLSQTPFCSVSNREEAQSAIENASFPAVLKRRHGGYDGYGQAKVDSADNLISAWDQLDNSPCVLESWINDIEEFSIVGARGGDGESRLYPPIANVHKDGQLRRSASPARIPAEALAQAEQAWHAITDHLGYQGTLTVEFFLQGASTVLINEIAPRVHNSGHLTLLSCAHSQFEMHVRGVTGKPLPHLHPTRDAVMLNLYPEHDLNDAEQAKALQAEIGGQIYLYGKKPRPRRKLGHWVLPPDRSPQAEDFLRKRS